MKAVLKKKIKAIIILNSKIKVIKKINKIFEKTINLAKIIMIFKNKIKIKLRF